MYKFFRTLSIYVAIVTGTALVVAEVNGVTVFRGLAWYVQTILYAGARR